MNICVVCTFASVFYGTAEADSVGFQDAGIALGQTFGMAFTYIWAIGLWATGLSSTSGSVVGGQIIMEGFVNIKVGFGGLGPSQTGFWGFRVAMRVLGV